jgi:hypothetical protein
MHVCDGNPILTTISLQTFGRCEFVLFPQQLADQTELPLIPVKWKVRTCHDFDISKGHGILGGTKTQWIWALGGFGAC